MAYWFVQHDVKAFREHPNLIGSTYKNKVGKIRKGDKIAYYATGDMVIIGTFDVMSNAHEMKNDPKWGTLWVLKIKKRHVSREPHVPIQEVLRENDLTLFPKRKIVGIKLKGQTAIPIDKQDFRTIEGQLKKPQPTNTFFRESTNDERLGEPAELRVMRFTPTNEMGVVVLFTSFMKQMGFEYFDFIRSGFPDACVYEKTESGLHRRFVEFEYTASQFRMHLKNPVHRRIKCDYVVCWENDYPLCPVKVIELKRVLLKLGIYREKSS
ncbi:MAG: hypothetical protein AB1529_02110 [Candidatus Micrarchaeota archaeon]